MKLNTLDDLLVDQLKDLYSAETQLTKALPKLAKKATTSSLAEAIQNHLEQTRHHVERLEEIGETLGVSLTGQKCRAMEGLIKEGAEAIDKNGDDRVIDAALIAGERILLWWQRWWRYYLRQRPRHGWRTRHRRLHTAPGVGRSRIGHAARPGPAKCT